MRYAEPVNCIHVASPKSAKRVALAVMSNKAKSHQVFSTVRLLQREPVFSDGQLYWLLAYIVTRVCSPRY